MAETYIKPVSLLKAMWVTMFYRSIALLYRSSPRYDHDVQRGNSSAQIESIYIKILRRNTC